MDLRRFLLIASISLLVAFLGVPGAPAATAPLADEDAPSVTTADGGCSASGIGIASCVYFCNPGTPQRVTAFGIVILNAAANCGGGSASCGGLGSCSATGTPATVPAAGTCVVFGAAAVTVFCSG